MQCIHILGTVVNFKVMHNDGYIVEFFLRNHLNFIHEGREK
jgi:hypothetical protein